jgi:hypothetical protein
MTPSDSHTIDGWSRYNPTRGSISTIVGVPLGTSLLTSLNEALAINGSDPILCVAPYRWSSKLLRRSPSRDLTLNHSE